MKKFCYLILVITLFSACKKDTTHEVEIIVKGDFVKRHVLNQPYTDAGATGFDFTKRELEVTIDISAVNINKTGSYTVKISATDEFGNIGTGERTVVVFNELEYLNGNWAFYKYLPGNGTPDTVYTETLMASETENRGFYFSRFSNYDNAPVYAHLFANQITIDTAQYLVGPSENVNLTISGNGLQMSTNRLEINYSEFLNNTTTLYTAAIER